MSTMEPTGIVVFGYICVNVPRATKLLRYFITKAENQQKY